MAGKGSFAVTYENYAVWLAATSLSVNRLVEHSASLWLVAEVGVYWSCYIANRLDRHAITVST